MVIGVTPLSRLILAPSTLVSSWSDWMGQTGAVPGASLVGDPTGERSLPIRPAPPGSALSPAMHAGLQGRALLSLPGFLRFSLARTGAVLVAVGPGRESRSPNPGDKPAGERPTRASDPEDDCAEAATAYIQSLPAARFATQVPVGWADVGSGARWRTRLVRRQRASSSALVLSPYCQLPFADCCLFCSISLRSLPPGTL